ncbi:hypothetical protein C0J52_16107 [Blattella germanica]|nr:hypothetical protein C0J52_16107 [Blattella germanica]
MCPAILTDHHILAASLCSSDSTWRQQNLNESSCLVAITLWLLQMVLVCVLFGLVHNLVSALGYSPQGQGQSQGQGGGNFVGGQQGGFGSAGGRGGGRSGADAGAYGGGSQGYGGPQDPSQYNFRIYYEPEYYGYESKFPGGKAMFKSYRSTDGSSGRQGGEGRFNAGGRNAGFGSGGSSGGGYGGSKSGFGAGGQGAGGYGGQRQF